MASRPKLPLIATLVLLGYPRIALADKLTITSNPPGAMVQLDGVAAGTTPFEKDFPGGYFHKTHTAFGKHLENSMVVRISLPGYVTKEVKLTYGPMDWHSLNGRNRFEYWLFKSSHFHVDLQPITEAFTGSITAKSEEPDASVQRELPPEEVVRQTKPSVVFLRGLDKSGSGFFVTTTGIIVTNAHLARGEETLSAQLSTGQKLEAKVVYIDDDLDIALVKVEDLSGKTASPRLALCSSSNVHQGETVMAIGNPGEAMPFSVTQGIVSAIGEFPNAGPGTWIQTDAPINPGNSGGPLLNLRGEVIGINTQKLALKNVSGIGFALSASDLLKVLRRFYPAATSRAEKPPAPSPSMETLTSPSPAAEPPSGTLVFKEPEGAEISVDGTDVGYIPATLKLKAAKHIIVLKDHVHADCIQAITVLRDSEVTFKPRVDCFAGPAIHPP